jgi:hypothetical protein
MNRLAYIGKKAEHIRRRFGEDEDEVQRAPRLVRAALDNVREPPSSAVSRITSIAARDWARCRNAGGCLSRSYSSD